MHLKNWGSQTYASFVVKKLGRILGFTSYLSYRNELTPRKGFVAIQATPHQPVWVGNWSFVNNNNNSNFAPISSKIKLSGATIPGD